MITYKEYIKQNEVFGVELFIHNLLDSYGKITTHDKNHHYSVDFHEVHCDKKQEILKKLSTNFRIKILDKCKVDLKIK